MLYISSGDGTSDSDTNLTGQDLTKLNAKVLRIDVDHPDPGKTYSVPKDNPFVGVKDARPETWAYGFRNPWRLHIDRKTGDLWVGQNGQDLWEQVYLVKREPTTAGASTRGAIRSTSIATAGRALCPSRSPNIRTPRCAR